MLMIPILDTAPEPGELVRFEVPAPVLAAATAAAQVSPSPPSFVQENHVRRLLVNRAAEKRQSPWVAVMFDIPGRLDPTAMAAALTVWARRHPTLLTWFSLDDGAGAAGSGDAAADGSTDAPGDDRILRHAVDPLAVSIEPVELGAYDSPTEIRDWLLELFDTSTDPLNWPPFAVASVVRDEASTVYYGVDHCHSDGLSALLVFPELRALYEAEVAGTVAALPETGSYVDYCALERERAAELSIDTPEVGRWLNFFLAGPPPTFPLPLGTEPGETYPKLSLTMDLLDGAASDAYAKACKANGAGFSAGVLAALGIAGYELGGHASYRGLSVVHTRDARQWMLSQGWFINLVPVEFPVADLPLRELLAGAQEGFAQARELAPVSPLRVAELIPGVSLQQGAGTVLPMVSYVDLRHSPGSKDWADANCHGLAGPGTSTDVPIWINRLWDRLYVKVTYPDTPAARANVPRFLAHLQGVLLSIASTGAYVPQAAAAEHRVAGG